MEFDGYSFWFTLNQLKQIKQLLLENNSDLNGFLDNYAECSPATVIECLKKKRSEICMLIRHVTEAIVYINRVQKEEIDNIDEEDLPFA